MHSYSPRFLYLLLVFVLALAGCAKKDATPSPSVPPVTTVTPPVDPHLTYLKLLADGTTNQALPLQKAIDSCSAAGGGTLVLRKGTYMIGPIYMKSSVTLRLDTLATLLASPNMPDFTVNGKVVNLINGPGGAIHDVTLTGAGTIDGNGAPWWAAFQANSALVRPRLIYITSCQNLTVSGLTLTNSPSFHLVPSQCQNVVISKLKIIAPSNSPNTDGIDPANCNQVSITNCTIDTGDDCIAIKSGRVNGALVDACQNLTVTGCTFLHGHGLSIGSETSSGVKNLTVTNCTFTGTTNGIRIKSEPGLGGLIQNVNYSNITMTGVTNPLVINMAYALNPNNSYPADIPSVNGMTIDHLTVTGAKNAGSLVGLTTLPILNLTLSNLTISAQTGLVMQNATGVVMSNWVINVTSGKSIITQNVQGTGF
ncbi:glycoside hydrolase family 28 protein [Hymenobacter sp. BRD67]|uniref:glycoside hydrolase family 28 protein n=1 Tax=Hymenobacter sp. BRD67 TaxID=2675877 RepID=UPI001566289B|nr:glycoside hydrolase family 28 protein [Hymenobacter sp. BRD67]QKG52908.1 glycoside hydrolase family 28 protein [Hymenobacter sp. BRD67]